MNENQSSSNPPNVNQPNSAPPVDWRTLRRQERKQRRAMRHEMRAQRYAWRGSNGWMIGAVFILIGVLLMLQNLGAVELRNGWALFILIPAFGSLAAAWRIFENNGALVSPIVIGPLFTSLILFAITAAFLFELNWGILGPVLLILLGVSALLGTLFWQR
jgi:hypothetical protein